MFDMDKDGKISRDEIPEARADLRAKTNKMIWNWMMKLFKLDKVKMADLGIEKPDYMP